MTSRLNTSRKEPPRGPRRRGSRKFVSWTVVATLFLNVFLTAVFPALISGGANAAFPQTAGEDVLVICTPNGLRFVRLDVNGEPAPVEKTDGGYCAFCQPFNHPILSAPAAATVASKCDYVLFHQPIPRDAEQGVASSSFTPLGSRAPPVLFI